MWRRWGRHRGAVGTPDTIRGQVTMTGQIHLPEVHRGKRPLFVYLFVHSFIHSYMHLFPLSFLPPSLLSTSMCLPGLCRGAAQSRPGHPSCAQDCATRCRGKGRKSPSSREQFSSALFQMHLLQDRNSSPHLVTRKALGRRLREGVGWLDLKRT